MKMFAIDVTNCELPEFWNTLPKVIRVTTGRQYKDFDVADEAINAQVRAIPEVLGNKDMPVGFDIQSIPVGATLTRLPDVDGDDYE